MKYIIAMMLPIGSLFWTVAYLLFFLKGMKDKSYGMPLVPMAFNFTWELIHSFIYPSTHNISLYFNISNVYDCQTIPTKRFYGTILKEKYTLV